MRMDFEENLLHPVTLGSYLIWVYALGYSERDEDGAGSPITKMMIVLPILYHRRSVNSIWRMNKDSGLLKALSDNPEITVGLQWRLEQLSSRTFQAIHLACGAKLIEPSQRGGIPTFVPMRRTVPEQLRIRERDVVQMQGASKRLGIWFQQLDISIISDLLGVNL